ncbi:MFS transporter [Acidiplasma sp.]|uniref:MFS transporter n=1 Tax=Acidiplasma sp. TaxID=1872114 RepID=UPI002586F76B|nr:MFS transporter [Acidiplasma sp.]
MSQNAVQVKTPWGNIRWSAFYAAWGGWVLDGFTTFVYAFIDLAATRYLLPATGISLSLTSFFLAAFFAVFLIGWGTSFIFGPLGDKYGRIKILSLSIILFAVGSVLSGLSTNAYEFMVFRFLTGLGIGAEWFSGGTTVAEVFPEDRRVMGAGLFHTGFYFGFLFAALAELVLEPFIGFRGMLILGGLPVIFIIYVRYKTKEPEKWVNVKRAAKNSLKARESFYSIFKKGYAKSTVIASLVMSAVILGLYSGTVYVPAIIEDITAKIAMLKYPVVYYVAAGGAEVSAFTIIGCILMPLMAEKLGRRITLIIFLVLMTISVVLIYDIIFYMNSLFYLYLAIPLLGLGGADFSVFTLWSPELYPTEFRNSGFAAITTFARYFAAALIFIIGYLALLVGFGHAVAYTAIGFVLVMPLVFLMKETRGQKLPEKILSGVKD